MLICMVDVVGYDCVVFGKGSVDFYNFKVICSM